MYRINMKIESFGHISTGEELSLITLTNKNGLEAVLTDFGASLVKLFVPDRDGHMRDVVLGYDDPLLYEKNYICYGATVGPIANRIAHHRFTLNGQEYVLSPWGGKDAMLHCFPDSYVLRKWDFEPEDGPDAQCVTFWLQSPDMEGGLPGNREMQVTYTLTDDNELLIRYFGLTDKDTLLAPTNPSSFTLTGHDAGPASDHFLWIDAEEIAAEDDEQCPTGAYIPVEGTVWDFRTSKRVGQDFGALVNGAPFPGYDECFIVNGGRFLEEADLVATLRSEESGIVMEVYTDMPSVQLYTANLSSDDAHTKMPGKGGQFYPNHAGVAIETQFVPNAVNIENAVVPLVKAGEQIESLTVYRFTTEG